MPNVARPCSVLVTGAGGNLGRKLVAHLLAADWCTKIVGVDLGFATSLAPDRCGRLTLITADLSNPKFRRWLGALAGVDAVVHSAAKNPFPDACWSDATTSFDVTSHLLGARCAAGVQRFAFASSNHVMGGYKDGALAEGLGPGELGADQPPGPGTRWHDGTRLVDSTAYATAKLMGSA